MNENVAATGSRVIQEQVLQVLVKFSLKALTVQKHKNIFSVAHTLMAYCLENFILLWPLISLTVIVPFFYGSGFDSEDGFLVLQA